MHNVLHSDHLSVGRIVLASLLLSGALACGGDDSKQMKQIAGRYAMRSHDSFANRLLEGSTLTLQEDGSWTSAIRLDPSLGTPWARDAGTWTYHSEGPTIRLRSSEGRLTAAVVRGDTLTTVPNERAQKFAESVTGVKATGGPDAFYVRVQ